MQSTDCTGMKRPLFIHSTGILPFKIKLPLCLTNHHATKTLWLRRYRATHYLTTALEGGEWLALRPGRFTPRERTPGIQ